MVYSFLDLAREVLHEAARPLSPSEIWLEGENYGLSEKVGSKGKTPAQTIGARLYVDIKNNKGTVFEQVSKRPAKFYLKGVIADLSALEETADIETTKERKFLERDLHILLSTFVYSNPHFNCYTKTIYHELSKKGKKGFNKWLHPDLVGIYFPFDEYKNNTLKLLEALKENPYKLFAFEMKCVLNFLNLRECYFQAVSNSSWANEGYLVTLKLEEDDDLKDEMRRLNNAFGIGIIKLDANNIEQSEILFSAKTKEYLDWDTIDRLTRENPDFEKFIDDLMEDIKLGKKKSNYDPLFKDGEETQKYATEKGIV